MRRRREPLAGETIKLRSQWTCVCMRTEHRGGGGVALAGGYLRANGFR